MGYLHINNLYRAQEILAFRECYALEKIHGTSAHVAWDGRTLRFFSGGEAHDRFVALFDAERLARLFHEKIEGPATVYGEAYGGKQQGMRTTYGPELRFITFDVRIGTSWLAVPQADEVAQGLGFEFVDYVLCPTTLEALDAERDKRSTQARRNGIEEPKIREGIVLRPPFEVTLNNGQRVIAKHKRPEFAERGSPKLMDLDPTKRQLLESAEAIAREWVTPMRLAHVVDHLKAERRGADLGIEDCAAVISAMVEDVTREAEGEIVNNKTVRRAIGSRAVRLFKELLRRLEPLTE